MKKTIFITLAGVIVVLVLSFGIVHALPYYPGQTLNPSCLPGATNCTVSGSWLFGGNTLTATGTLGTLSANDLNFITNSSTRMTILSGGDVLIGTSTIPSGAPAGSLIIGGNYYGNGSLLTGVSGGSSLPSQTGNAGDFLVTNGTSASWTPAADAPAWQICNPAGCGSESSNGYYAIMNPSGVTFDECGVNLATAATGSDVWVDIQNSSGTSIFSAGHIVIPVGSTSEVFNSSFTSSPYTAAKGTKFRAVVTQNDSGGTAQFAYIRCRVH